MSDWNRYNIDDLIRQILDSAQPETTYGTGRPFMTTYQIAIEFARRFPNVVAALGHAVGGEGQGPFALTVYFARWLPTRITSPNGPLRGIMEVRFLAPVHLVSLEFDNNGTPLTATTNQAGWNSTMFRLLDDQTGPGEGLGT
jgi:hypothetical protein